MHLNTYFLLQNNSKVWNILFSLVSLRVKWSIFIYIDDHRNALFSGLYCSLYHENARTENDRCQFDNSFDINNLIKIRDTCKMPPSPNDQTILVRIISTFVKSVFRFCLTF